MKKLFPFLILLIFSLSTSAQSQLIGFKGGMSWTDIPPNRPYYGPEYGPDVISYRRGFAGGLTYDYITKNKLIFGAEVLYEERGFSQPASYVINENDYLPGRLYYNYNYISIPVKVGYKIGKSFYGIFDLGISPAMLVRANVKGKELQENGMMQTNYYGAGDISSNYDMAALAEIGCGYELGNGFAMVSSFRYHYSLTPEYCNLPFSNTILSKGITVSVGIKYDLAGN